MTDTPNCWNCGQALEGLLLPVSRHEYCDHCAEAVHCCRMCGHFDANRTEQCREDRAEPPTDKTCANFCDFFQIRSGGAASGSDRQTQARAGLDALFGGDSSKD
jgi:hypothetical protein